MWIQSFQMQVRNRLGTKAGHNSEKNTLSPRKKALQQTFRKIRMQQPLVLTSIVDLIPLDRHHLAEYVSESRTRWSGYVAISTECKPKLILSQKITKQVLEILKTMTFLAMKRKQGSGSDSWVLCLPDPDPYVFVVQVQSSLNTEFLIKSS